MTRPVRPVAAAGRGTAARSVAFEVGIDLAQMRRAATRVD
jgi:hypothetical protein